MRQAFSVTLKRRMVCGQSYQISSRTCTIGGLGKITACCYTPNQILPLDERSFGWSKRKSFLQKWDDRVIIDGAHNPAAACVLAQTWRELFGDKRATLILATLSDKDIRGICEALVPIADSILLPKIRSERAAEPGEIAKVISSTASALPCSATASIADALQLARTKPNPILLTGSLHFAGEALALLRGEPAAFEECAQ